MKASSLAPPRPVEQGVWGVLPLIPRPLVQLPQQSQTPAPADSPCGNGAKFCAEGPAVLTEPLSFPWHTDRQTGRRTPSNSSLLPCDRSGGALALRAGFRSLLLITTGAAATTTEPLPRAFHAQSIMPMLHLHYSGHLSPIAVLGAQVPGSLARARGDPARQGGAGQPPSEPMPSTTLHPPLPGFWQPTLRTPHAPFLLPPHSFLSLWPRVNPKESTWV